MDRVFDYSQKILVAIEKGRSPSAVPGLPASHEVFERVTIPQAIGAFNRVANPLARMIAGGKFRKVLDQRMGYWEEWIPADQSCFVHYLRGSESEVAAAFNRFKAVSNDWLMVGVYHMEPQSSAYPFGFPINPVPHHWFLGESRSFSADSVFWFNFFPAQPHLFEKTFITWALFVLFRGKEGAECNQLVALDGEERIVTSGIDRFVQINLNRFSSFAGYFASAREAGKHTFTEDREYFWYGMLLSRYRR